MKVRSLYVCLCRSFSFHLENGGSLPFVPMVDGGWSNPLDAHERDALAVIPSSCSHNGLELDTDLQAMWLIRSSPLHGSAG